MRTGRKLQNRERVEKCKETLDQLSRFMGDILDGKLSQREAAEALGLTDEFICNNIPPVPIIETGMSAATKRSLLRGGVETLSELAGYSKKEVLVIRSIGEKGLREIREELARYGGHLTESESL